MRSFKNIDELKKDIDNVHIPDELDDVITQSIEKGSRVKKRKLNTKIASVACLIFIIIGINISPAFASAVKDIPFLGDFVTIFKFDRGIEKAISEGYVQHVGKSVEKDGFIFTVDNIVADNNRIVFEYTIEDINNSINDNDNIRIWPDIELYDGENNKWIIRQNSDKLFDKYEQVDNKYKFAEDIVLGRNQKLSKSIEFRLRDIEVIDLESGNRNEYKTKDEKGWVIDIALDKKFLSTCENISHMDNVIQIGDFKFQIEKIEVTPTTTHVILNEIENNDFILKEIENLWLEDEEGNRYELVGKELRYRNRGTGGNGIVRRAYLDMKFESTYYNKYKSLYLKGSNVLYSKKEEAELVIDLNKEKIINDGEISGLELGEIRYNEEFKNLYPKTICDFNLYFNINNNEEFKTFISVLGPFNLMDDKGLDNQGYEYYVYNNFNSKFIMGFSWVGKNINIEKEAIKKTYIEKIEGYKPYLVKIKIKNPPAGIIDDFEVRIK